MRIIRTKELLGIIGVSRTTLWRMVRAGRFPRPVMISAWASGFRDDEVGAWLAALTRRPGGGEFERVEAAAPNKKGASSLAP